MNNNIIILVVFAVFIGLAASTIKFKIREKAKAKAKAKRLAHRHPKHTNRSIKVRAVETGKVIPKPVVESNAWSVKLIRALEWKRFEQLCMLYFHAKGYRAETTEVGPDGRVDVRLYKPSAPNELLAVVQCKAWKNRNVGVKHVRELYGVQAAAKAPMGIFITSSRFSKDAHTFSEDKHLQLLDGQKLYSLIDGLEETVKQEMLKEITTGDYTTPTCVSCDIKMTKRETSKGRSEDQAFWGCANFPRCRNTIQVVNI